MSSSEWLLLLLVSLACGICAGGIAQAKNRDVVGYFLLGFFFSIIGLITIGFMPAKPPPIGPKRWHLSSKVLVVVFATFVFVGVASILLKTLGWR